ncbi:MAG TPA: hypothetical protein GXZ43_07795 [Clostridiaceae bacterium]|nr:hypothetical protein [Clostridiaceae bacterium]
MLIAGVSICDLSPEKGVDLGGYPYFHRPNTGIHDPIYGAVLFLDDGNNNKILLLISDLFYLTKNMADRLRKSVSDYTGFAKERIIVTCSHTHSAPWMSSMFEDINEESDYAPVIDENHNDFVMEEYSKAAAEALNNSFEAEIAYVKTQCGRKQGIGGNRRHPENGPCDEDLPLFLVRDKEHVLRAVFTKYALHPTILHGENVLVSADFPGAMRKEINKVYPSAVFLFAQGTSGDQSPRYFRKDQSFAEVERFGKTLADSVLQAIPSADYTDEVKLSFGCFEMELVQKKYGNPEEYKKQLGELRIKEQKLIQNNAPYVDLQNANLAVLGAECDYSNSKKAITGEVQQRYDASAPFLTNILLINNVALVFLPGEIFSQFGLDIKEKSPYSETHVITLANGDLPGYCVTKEALAEGGYEPYNSILDPVSGERIVNTVINGLETIKNNFEKGF